MHFLNGDRLYIIPRSSLTSVETQFDDCLRQIGELNRNNSIYKLNFFLGRNQHIDNYILAEIASKKISEKLKSKIILNFINQQPIGSKILAEVFLFDPTLWESEFIQVNNGKAMFFSLNGTEVMAGNVQFFKGLDCNENSINAFIAMKEILNIKGFSISNIIRQWNYIDNILGFDGEKQCYQEFNHIRSDFYMSHFNKGYPAATGIGMSGGGIIIEFIAVKSQTAKSYAINNPMQIAAHSYSEKVLLLTGLAKKSTPKFERGLFFELFGKKEIFISGTASIRGENTVEKGNPSEQTEITIQNIKQLYSDDILNSLSTKMLKPQYGHARVYIKNRKDYPAIKKRFRIHYGNLPVVYLIADICRDDLLVEIEGEVILE